MLLFLRFIDWYKFLSFIIAVKLIFLDIEFKKPNNTVYLDIFVHQKALLPIFHTSFLTTK